MALDLGGRGAYAIRFRNGHVKCRPFCLARGKLTGKRNPIPMIRLYRRLEKLAEHFQIRKVIFEETFGRGEARHRLDSLQYAVILWAMRSNIRWQRVSPPAWKKAVLGRNVSKTEYTEAGLKKWEHLWTDDQCAAMWILEFESKGD